jgi:hypothetical protein
MTEDVIYLTKDFEPVSEDDPRMAMVKVRYPDGRIVFGFPEEEEAETKKNTFEDHKGRPGQVGGSLPRDGGKGSKDKITIGSGIESGNSAYTKESGIAYTGLDGVEVPALAENEIYLVRFSTEDERDRVGHFAYGGKNIDDVINSTQAYAHELGGEGYLIIGRTEEPDWDYSIENEADGIEVNGILGTEYAPVDVVVPVAIKKAKQNRLFHQGGPGSGFQGHAGRPGMVGGSVSEEKEVEKQSGGKSMAVYHGTSIHNVASIQVKGILAKEATIGKRPPSVYFMNDFQSTKEYVEETHTMEGRGFAIIEFEIPNGIKVIEDEEEGDSYRIEQSVPPGWIKSITYYNHKGQRIGL